MKKIETNFDHYFEEIKKIKKQRKFINYTQAEAVLFCSVENEELASLVNVVEWLFNEYVGKYALTKTDYDILDSFKHHEHYINDCYYLKNLAEKGYFRDVPKDIKIERIIRDSFIIDATEGDTYGQGEDL